MKKLLLTLLLSTSLSTFADDHLESLPDGFCYESPKVQVRNSLFFLPNQALPFTGENLCVYSKNGQYHSQGEITNGKQEGWWIWWKENGEIWKKEQYEDGDKIGYKKITFNEYGQIGKEKIYQNGNLSGETKYLYYENGQLKQKASYKDNKFHGKATLWFENGMLISEWDYLNGILISKSTRYENDQIKYRENYKDGNLIRKSHWYKNGQKRLGGGYKDGDRDGVWTDWYENGQKKQVRYYKDGWEEGKWTYWDKSGQIISQEEYKDGVCISGDCPK